MCSRNTYAHASVSMLYRTLCYLHTDAPVPRLIFACKLLLPMTHPYIANILTHPLLPLNWVIACSFVVQ